MIKIDYKFLNAYQEYKYKAKCTLKNNQFFINKR